MFNFFLIALIPVEIPYSDICNETAAEPYV